MDGLVIGEARALCGNNLIADSAGLSSLVSSIGVCAPFGRLPA